MKSISLFTALDYTDAQETYILVIERSIQMMNTNLTIYQKV